MLSQRLRTARKAKGLTQEELAEHVCTTKGTISNYENNHSTPPNDMLRHLADILNVTTDWLLGRTDDVTPSSFPVSEAKEKRSLDELLQEKIDDPDDYYFLDGYLEASEEEKKEIRRYWYDLRKQWKVRQVKESRPPSLFDITEGLKKNNP
ncbi:MAG: transcriptional regulator [Brevibacillus sp.]|nr:transcriptional regulator [Brevibacillus sp.]